MLNIDELIKLGVMRKQERIRRFDLTWSQFYGEHLEERIETDSIPFASASSDQGYREIVLASDPKHYYRLGEESGTTLSDEVPVGAVDGTYNVAADHAEIVLGGALYTDSDSAKKLDYGTRYARASLNWGAAGTQSAFTVEVWIKPLGTSEDLDGLLGWMAGGYGFNLGIRHHKLYITTTGSSGATQFQCLTLQPNEWQHVVLTIGTDKVCKAYLNGVIVATQSLLSGFQLPGAAEFQISRVSSLNDVPNWGCDELALYDTVLSASEIMEHYSRALTGSGLAGGDPDATNPFVADRELPELEAEEDIGYLVSGWNVTRDAQNLVQSCSIELHDEWAYDRAKEKLAAGTYVIIDIRYTSPEHGIDTGWRPVAHLISQGPVRGSDSATGDLTFTCVANGLLGLLSLDMVNYDTTPDIIRVPRREATRTYSDLDIIKFRMNRVGTTTQFLYNWVDRPMTRIWATEFQNRGSGDPAFADILPVKSAQGSIQIVGGAGEVIFNTRFFQDRVSENGLGDPDKIELQFDRFATAEDVVLRDLVSAVNTYSGGAPVKATLTFDNSDSQFDENDGYIGRTIFVKSGGEKGEIFKIVDASASGGNFGFDVKTIDKVIPDFADYDLAAGDECQITDPNFVEDALWKVLYHNGFQMKDPTKPFYVNLYAPVTRIQVPPLNYRYNENVKDLDLLQEILDYAPPNFYICELPHGFIETTTTVQRPIGQWDHDITPAVISKGEDASGYGIFTRVIVEGEGNRNFNIALHKDSGGYALSGAYKLSDFYGLGTLSQGDADDWIKQIFDPDPKSPQVSGDAPYNYGLIYEKNPATRSVTFADEAICWLDIGRNSSTGNPWLVDAAEFLSFSSYRDGNYTKQSLRMYFMTEEDYISATGHIPKAIPGHAADEATIRANMNTLKTSYLWKLVIDETQTDEGQTSVESSDFVDGRAENVRFIKIECAQPWYRLGSTATDGIARIVLPGVKLWLSRKIVRTAELGVDAEFASVDWVERATDYRRRTAILEKNLALDSSEACKQFAIDELRELATEFEPQTFQVVSALVDVHQTVRYVNPRTGLERNFVVRSVDITGGENDVRNVVAVDYETLGA